MIDDSKFTKSIRNANKFTSVASCVDRLNYLLKLKESQEVLVIERYIERPLPNDPITGKSILIAFYKQDLFLGWFKEIYEIRLRGIDNEL